MINLGINLGDKVKDKVTGFTGIAIGRTTWLHGCDRYVVQPIVGKDGKLPENQVFDELQLEVVSKKKGKRSENQTGGYDFKVGQKDIPSKY